MSISTEEGVPTPAKLFIPEQEQELNQEYAYPAEYYYPVQYEYSGEAWNPNPYTFTPCYPTYYPYNFNDYCYDEAYMYYEGDPNYSCNYSWGSGEISAEELSEELESSDARTTVKVETHKQIQVEKKAPRGPRPSRQPNRGKSSKSKKGKHPPENTKKIQETPKNYSRPKVHYRQVIPKVEKVAPISIGFPEVAGAMWADVDPDEEMDFSVSVYGN